MRLIDEIKELFFCFKALKRFLASCSNAKPGSFLPGIQGE